MEGVTTAILIDKRRVKKDGTYPVKLRVTYQGEQRYYKTQYSFTEEKFNGIMEKKTKKGLKEFKLKLNKLEQKVVDIINEMEDFSFSLFEKQFSSKPSDRSNIFYSYEQRIKTLFDEGRIKYAKGYQSSMASLKAFLNKDKSGTEEKSEKVQVKEVLDFKRIDQSFLKSYEQWMLSEGNSLSTIGIYLRDVRTLFNEAIAEKNIKTSIYPFGKRKYQIPNSSNVKKAIPLSEIEKIFDYEPQHKDEALARDLWIFSYLCNGINVKDIAKLKYENISGEIITFLRSKTLRTSRKNLKPIVALITPEVSLILQKWGNQPCLPHSYVFPILSNNDNLEQQEAKITNITRSINHYMKKIGEKLGINKKITTYVARHSYATIMVENGAPIALISEDLGHKGIGTTQLYIGNLETSEKKKYINCLTDFRK